MAQQIINTGTAELAGDGESIRSAFQKINTNFTELYTSGGGVVDFTNIASHVLPASNLTYDLGSTATQWRSLYVGTGTIYIGGVPITVNAVNNTLVVGNTPGEEPTTATNLATESYVIDYVNQNIGTSSAIVEREISFPSGNEGDIRGTIALTPDGQTYICTANWADSQSQYQGSFQGTTSEAYNVGQSGGSFNQAIFLIADEPELYYILQYGTWNEGQLTADAGPDFGGAQNVVNTGINIQDGYITFVWLHRESDPNDIAQGTNITINFSGTVPQPAIWRRLVDLNANDPYNPGDGAFSWTSEGDLTIETIRPEGYDGDCDVNIYAADDIWIRANGDEAEIRANTNVRIVSDDGNHQWTFAQNGSLQLPNINNTGYQPGYNLNGPTLMLGGENDPYDQVIITGPAPTENNISAQRIVIQGQKGFGGNNIAGEGGDIYIWGGTGGESNSGNVSGDGGDIKVRGGAGQFGGAGGYVKIEGGNTFYGPGGVGGYVEISAGDGQGGGNTDGGDVRIRAGRKQGTGNNGIVTVQTGANSEFEWQFDNGGTLNLAVSNNISTVQSSGSVILNADTKNWSFDTTGRLTLPPGGDITDSNGSSVLGGSSAIPNTVKGWYMLQGRRPNNNNDVIFQAVTNVGDWTYVVGKNEYAQNNWENSVPVVQKIDRSTGEVLWSKRIAAGRNAQFQFTIAGGVVSLDYVLNGGTGYKADEQLVISGYDLGGSHPAGSIYVQVNAVDQTGAITSASISQQPTTPGFDGSYNYINVYNNNNNVEPHSIAYDLDGERVVVSCRTNKGAWSQEDSYIAYIEIYCLDDVTGAVNQTWTLKDSADMEPTSVAVNNIGDIVVVGQKYNEYRSFGTLSILSPGNGYFDILKSNLDAEHYPNSGLPGDEAYNFFIQGTGIAYQEGVDNINYYQNVTTTVREGSGTVTIDVIANGSGPYTYGDVTVQAGGTNYRVGHKIKYLGTQLGGATPANDLILTVTGVDGSGAITTATAAGTAPSGSTIIGLTAGANYQVGSGAAVNFNISPVTGNITSVGTGNFGDYHYVVGDVLTVAGTNFANGTSPANDVVLTVTDVYFGGPNGYTITSGTVPSDAVRIQVDGINFNTPGSWTMRQTLGGEAFIWTPNWNKAIGSSVNDWFTSVAFSPDGQSIYAVGKGQYDVNYGQALVVKFAKNTGNIVWSKYVNSYLDEGSEVSAEAMSVVTQSNGNVIVAIGNQYNPSNGRNEHGIVCLNSNGELQWAKTYQEPNDNFDDECKVLRNSDDDLFLIYRSYSGGENDAYALIKVDGDNGDTAWARGLSNGGNSQYFNYSWGNDFAVLGGTDIIIAGYSYIPNDNYYNGLLIKFPQDGFKTFDAQGYDFGQQFGDLRLYDLVTTTFAQTQAPATFTPEVHADAVTTVSNERAFATVTDVNHPHTYLQYLTRDDQGYLEFGDGSKQSFATDKIPQILGSYSQDIKLSPQDSGKHFFFDQNCYGATIIIPAYDIEDPYPVGYTITIVNCSGSDIYVRMDSPDNGNYWYGSIWGSGRNTQTRYWGIPDSGSGSIVTLMKVKNAQYTGGENESGPIWMIAGPADLYNND